LDETVSTEYIYLDASDEKAQSEDIPATTNAPVTACADAPAATAATIVS
jgi:hypothetical protein